MNDSADTSSLADPAEWLERAARTQPRRLFLSTPAGRRLTYAELAEHCARYAAALAACGVQPGDRVAVWVEKSPEAIVLYLACLAAGAVLVPINVASSLSELEHFLEDSRPRLAVVRPASRESLTPLLERIGVPCVETLAADGAGTFAEKAACVAYGLPRLRAPASNDLAALVYTSGTTGRSKGAMLTRGNLVSNAAALAAAWRFSCEDVLLHTLPLFHVHGLFAAINTVLASASSLVLLPRFDAGAVIELLADATVLMGVPTHYARLLADGRLDRRASARVRLFVSGSAPLLAETHQAFFERTGHRILERYGMTETLMNTSNPYEGPRVPGSVGPALPGVEVRVTERASGGVLSEPEAIGALEVRGPNVFAGYWRDPEKTRAAFTADGWFRTGDLGRIDAAGYVYLVGRAKDLVISGGHNVYPREVEIELDAVPGVLESAVFGVPHPDFGEGVTAVVVLAPGASVTEVELIEALRPRLARYKVPKRLFLVAELPRNPMGKVRKEALRVTYADLYASGR